MRGLILCFISLWLAACGDSVAPQGPAYVGQSQPESRPIYHFAVHPLHNPQKLHQIFSPLMRYLDQRVPQARFELEASSSYAHFEEKLKAGSVEFALPNPYHAVRAREWRYRVIAKMGNDQDFRGIFLVRNDSGIKTPADLRGKVVSYPAPTALAAAMMPQLYLHNHGLDVNKDIKNSYVGTHESSIMNVYLGQSAAGATWPPPWRVFQREHPKEAGEMHLAWQTEILVQNAIIVRQDVPAAVADGVREALVHMHENPEGRSILAGIETPSMDVADDRSFDKVARFLDEFRAKVRTP